MNRARLRLGTSQGVAVAALALVFVFLNSVPLWHTDVWGHLGFGRAIAETARLPVGNPFSPWMAEEVPSNHYAWLSQAVLYRVYALGERLAGGDSIRRLAGGVDALRFTHALAVVLCLGVLLRAYRRVGGSLPLALTGVVLVTVMSRNLAIFRPQVLGELCFALLLLGLAESKRGRPAPSRAGLVWIPLLMCLWANLHGSFAFGLCLITLVLVGSTLETAWKLGPGWPAALRKHGELRSLLLLWGASVLGVAVFNPAGPMIYLRTLTMAGHPAVTAMTEWQPLSFSLAFGGHWLYLISLALVFGCLLRARRWPSASRALVFAFFACLPFLHQRGLVWWLLVAPWIALTAWADRPAPGTGGRRGAAVSKGPLRALAAGVLVVAVTLTSIPARWIEAGQPTPLEASLSEGTPWRLALALRRDPDRSESGFPELEAWLDRNFPGGFRGPIFSSERLGDYLVWALPPEMAPFVYAHVHLFTEAHWQLYSAVWSGTESWSQVLDRFRIDLIVIEAELAPKLRSRLYESRDWKILLDESGDLDKLDRYGRLLVAVRSQPLGRHSRPPEPR